MPELKLLTLVITFTLSGQFNLSAQSRWVHFYHDGIDAPILDFIEDYDHGYLITGKFGANYSKYNWLLKTDINGEILWEITIGDGIHPIALLGLEKDLFGNHYLCGGTNIIDPEGDPLLIKIDSCGEKQWCQIFYTDNNHDFASELTVTPDGSVILLLTENNEEYWIDPICIAKVSPDGEMIWKQCYTTSDTNQRNEITREIICTPDLGFLVSGFCYYQDPTLPNHWIVHPYYLKVDSTGNFEWETVIFKETNLDGGAAWNTVISPDGNYYYSSLSHYLFDDKQMLPALAKMDIQGNVVGVYDVVTDYSYGFLASAKFLNVSTIAAEASWGYTEEGTWAHAVIIDTIGNLLNTALINQDIYESILQIGNDGKLVYGSNTVHNGQFSFFLTKLNQNLEQDTFYTRPFTYDSLCPYQIVSDTIVPDDCGIIVGVEEEGKTGRRDEGMKGGLEVWPNPARTIVNCQLSTVGCRGNFTLVIYDIFGREVEQINVSDGKEEFQISVESYPPGVYIAILKNGPDIIESQKFVVAR